MSEGTDMKDHHALIHGEISFKGIFTFFYLRFQQAATHFPILWCSFLECQGPKRCEMNDDAMMTM